MKIVFLKSIYFYVCFLCISYNILSESEIHPNDSFESLTKDTIDTIIEKNNINLFLFYSPFCKDCESIYKEVEKVNQFLKETPKHQLHNKINFYKLNYEEEIYSKGDEKTINSNLDYYKNQGFILPKSTNLKPFIFISVKKESDIRYKDLDKFDEKSNDPNIKEEKLDENSKYFIYQYHKEHLITLDNLMKWLTKHLISILSIISDYETLERQVRPSIPNIIFFCNRNYSIPQLNNKKVNNDFLKIFISYAYSTDEYDFSYCSYTQKIFGLAHISSNRDLDTLVVFKDFDGQRDDWILSRKKNKKTEFNFEILHQYLLTVAVPDILPLNSKSKDILFNQNKPGLIFLRDSSNREHTKYDDIISNIAPQFKKKLQTIISGFNNDEEIEFAKYFGVTLSDCPIILIVDTRNDYKNYKIYKYKEELKEGKISVFIDQWEKGKAIPDISGKNEEFKQKDEKNNNNKSDL